VFATRAADLGQLLRKYEIPAAGWSPVPAVMRAGFLFGYGDDVAKVSRRAAEIGVRVLKGAKPSEIPVEQADEFSLFINSGVAKMLRVRIPESVRARTSRIEP
jgi:putative ABC transport system substrate-binding protein